MHWLRNTVVLAAAAGIVIGLISGYSIASLRMQNQLASIIEAFRPLRASDDTLSLVNPLIAYDTPESITLDEYQELKSRIERLIDTYKETRNIRGVSVYYRNLETGAWIGIEQNSYFYPASLLKVPVMIAYFKQAEAQPAILSTRIRYQPVTSTDTFNAISKSSLISGTSYSVDELIKRMIVDSDNGATYSLIDHVNKNILNEVYTDIGIEHPADDSSLYTISTKTYALFFRVLYNTTYLSPTFSQKALELLSQATFKDGLVAGVPESVTVAHKFGEHVLSSDRKNADGVELHDCGIIYHPKQRYLLCVMTDAKGLPDAADMIKAISKETYETVDADVNDS